MFCPRCGAKETSDALFCRKCGAKLNDNAEPFQTEVTGRQTPPCGVELDKPPKKKSRKIPIIAGAAVLLAVVFLAALPGKQDEKPPERSEPSERSEQTEAEDVSRQSSGVRLSEHYTNETDGISFQYPSAWKPIEKEKFIKRYGSLDGEDYPLVLLANEIDDLPEENSYIMLSKIDAEQDMIDHLFVDDEQFAATFDSDVTVQDTSVTEIDGTPARKITYVDADGIGFQSYFYAAGRTLYRLDFSYQGGSAGNLQRFFDAVLDSCTITADDSADGAPEDTGSTLCYQGIPAETIMAMTADDLIAAFGEPDYRDEYFYEYYEKGIMVSFDSMGQISTFSGKVEEYERNGKNLNQNQSGLAEIFGREPDHQETYDMTELKWYDTSCSVNIRINDDGLPCKVELWRKQTVEEAEGLLRELLVDYGQSEILYPDYVSEGFLPLNGLQVYNFNLVDSFYGLCLPVAVETDSAMLWAVPDDEETVPLSGYLTNRYEEEAVPPASGLPDGFQWVETPSGTTDEWSTTITGILQNVSDQTYDYASISFNLYDAAGNQVGTADASIQNLKAGGTWKFSAVGFAPSARFELSSVTYF